jgi:hypothetical protein
VPELPQRKRNSKGKGERTTGRPYTAMALNGLSVGLTWRDMRHMKYTHLSQILYEWDDMNGADVDEYVNATDADIKALMSL